MKKYYFSYKYIGIIILACSIFPQKIFSAECSCNFEIDISSCAGGTLDNPRLTGGTLRHTHVINLSTENVTKNNLHMRIKAYGETACNIAGRPERAQEYGGAVQTSWQGVEVVIDENNCRDSTYFRAIGMLANASCSVVGASPTPPPIVEEPTLYQPIPFSLPSTDSIRISKAQSIPQLIGQGLRLFTGVFGSIALVMVIYGGVQIMTAAGQSDKIKQGSKIIVWASIGLITMMLSNLLVTFVLGAIT
jgi:hypothetical protein